MIGPRFAVLMVVAGAAFIGVERSGSGAWLPGTAAHAQVPDCPATTMVGGFPKCKILIDASDSDGKCTVTAPANVTFPMTLSNITVVWRVKNNDDRFVFCRMLGDGVFLKDPAHATHKQINRMWAGNDNELETAPDDLECKLRYRVNFKNRRHATQAPPDTEYNCAIRFRLKADLQQKCEVDPWIRNGSVGATPLGAKTSR